MKSLVSIAIAKPRTVLAVWFSLVGVLALVGLGVESKLHRSDLVVPGTATEETLRSLEPEFGQSFDEIVVLKGPRAAVDAQGPTLTGRLDRIPGVSLLAPWLGSNDSLRPRRDTALIVIRSKGDFDFVSKQIAPRIREVSKQTVSPPVEASVSGYPDIAAGLHGGTVEAIQQAEIIAVPLLMIILLLVFKSPVAAALPLLVGLTTIGAARGGLTLINGAYPLDALALNVASMMGLALGVDYALLLVSRFRDELGSGLSPPQAAMTAGRRTGRTIVSAGVALAAAMTAAIFVVPGALLVGVGLALISVVVLSVLGALIVLPASLTLLGANVDRWTLGDVQRPSRISGLALRAQRHPALALAIALIAVGALAAGSLRLETGPPDPRGLPPGNEQRSDYLAVKDALGGGWIAPYEIGITSDNGPLTERRRLLAIDRFQRRLVKRPDVAAVLGPGRIVQRTKPLEQVPAGLARTRRFLDRGIENQNELANGLTRIGAGVDQMRGGLSTAASAAGQLESGGGAATSAAWRLHSGLGKAGTGAQKLHSGLSQAKTAIDGLAQGSRRAHRAAGKIGQAIAAARPGLVRGIPQVKELRSRLDEQAAALEQLRGPARATRQGLERGLSALDRMDGAAQADPEYGAAYNAFSAALRAVSGDDPANGGRVDPSYAGIDASLAAASDSAAVASRGVGALLSQTRDLAVGLGRLESGSDKLEGGLKKLEGGATRLLGGFERLAGGDDELIDGLDRLRYGSEALATGVDRLAGGAGALRSGLTEGAGNVETLGSGVSRMLSGVLVFRGKSHKLSKQSQQTVQLTPVFESGYFTLAALDRAKPQLRRNASFALSIDSGGSGARITVVGYGEPQKAGHPLRGVLEDDLDGLAAQTGARAQLGGTATGLQDFDTATANHLPLLALTLSIVTFIVLVWVLRSVLLPFLAVAFNLLTVLAAFGVTVLLFEGPNPLLGGPGFIDAITAFGVFSVMFGLSIDYEVFLLVRMREGYELKGSTEGAIEYGIKKTAGVITGAALIMTAVFLSFATTGITPARQFGLALTVAVLVDATLIRLVLLPAAMRLCGKANWWLPKPLRRLLDRGQVGWAES